MKICTVIYKSVIGSWIHKALPIWMQAARQFYDESDIVVITDRADDWKHKVKNLVEAEPLGFVPRNAKQQVTRSDCYRMQAYRLIKEPVMFLDLDCILHTRLPNFDDETFRILSGYRPPRIARTKVGDQIFGRGCAAVLYQGRDLYDEYLQALATLVLDPEHVDTRGIGETAINLMAYRLGNTEMLPRAYGWSAHKEPYPKDLKVLHYVNGRGKKALIHGKHK